MDNIEEIIQAISVALVVASFLYNTGRGLKAIELCKEGLVVLNDKTLEKEKHLRNFFFERIYFIMLRVYFDYRDFKKAAEYGRKLLSICHEDGETVLEGMISMALAEIYKIQNEPADAKELYETAVGIMNKTGNRQEEALACQGLADVFESLFDYDKAREYYEKSLAITIEIGDRQGEATAYGKLGTLFESHAEYENAKEYLERALAIATEIGDREGEANAYGTLGTVFQSLAQYDNAKEHYEKALAITIEIGDKDGEATTYQNLGNVFKNIAEYENAKEYLEKSLAINIEICDREGEANAYENLGIVFQCLAEFENAKEYLEKSLAIKIEIGDKDGEATAYQNLGVLFCQLNEYDKSEGYIKKALEIRIKMGDRRHEETIYGGLGYLLISRGKYYEANDYIRKALARASETGNRREEARLNHSLGDLFENIGDYVKAKEHFEKALTLAMAIGHRETQVACYGSLGSLYKSQGEYVKAEEYLQKAILMSKNIGALEMERVCCHNLAFAKLLEKKSQEAFPYLFKSVNKTEVCRRFLKDNDELKVLYSDTQMLSLKLLSFSFRVAGNFKKALYAEELARARALSDLMAAQYSVESHISADPQSWTDIPENVVNLGSDSTCLFISYIDQIVSLWILKASGDIQHRTLTVDKKTLNAALATNLDEYFVNIAQSFRSFGILPEEKCEDRSLNGTESKPDSSHQENLAVLRDAKNKVDPKPSLTLFYQMIIAPVANLLATPEIIIVPERSLFRVPFPALLDERGKYLSETFRIRIVPSLTTLKLIQDSPADYHSQTGALIVGEPYVGEVLLRGKRKTFSPLNCARNEAEMIGQWLGVKPLIGKHATKQAVLQRIHSVSLVHLAAHGDAERGEIVLAPERTGGGTPRDEDYLLTMSDISKVQLRAKLVVLSCCHSARGQIRAEGVIGIARAFLGSGARSVLVSLWALEDSATEHFMRRFYKNLMREKTASESLHQVMKWMRVHGYSDVSEWAPFQLIGDDVTFVFENNMKALLMKEFR